MPVRPSVQSKYHGPSVPVFGEARSCVLESREPPASAKSILYSAPASRRQAASPAWLSESVGTVVSLSTKNASTNVTVLPATS